METEIFLFLCVWAFITGIFVSRYILKPVGRWLRPMFIRDYDEKE